MNDKLDHYEECIDAKLLLEEEVILVFQLFIFFYVKVATEYAHQPDHVEADTWSNLVFVGSSLRLLELR